MNNPTGGPNRYRRVLLKLSGESLQDREDGKTICQTALQKAAGQIRAGAAAGIQIAVVIGGGNIFRGLSASAGGMQRTVADGMGMLATLINSLALLDTLEQAGQPASVYSALPVQGLARLIEPVQVVRDLTAGRVVILAGGTGHSFFTTDTAAALRAAEIGADIIFKGTRVDGVYSADPEKDPDAEFYPEISYETVLNRGLRVMDLTAISFCRENRLPIRIFNMEQDGAILQALQGCDIGSVVS